MVAWVLVTWSILFAVILGVIWYWIGRRISSHEDRETSVRDRIRRWRRRGHWIGLLNGTILFLILVDSNPLHIETILLSWGLPESISLGLTWALIAGMGYLPAIGTLVGLLPAARQTYEETRTRTSFVVMWSQYYVVLWGLLTACAVVGAAGYRYGGIPLGATVGLFCLQLVRYAGNPLFSRLFWTVREPTATESGRLDALCESAGLSVDTYQVIDLYEPIVMMEVRGSPLYRSLITTSKTLETGSDAQLESILTQCGALVDTRFRFWRFVLNALTILPSIWLVFLGIFTAASLTNYAALGFFALYFVGASQLQRAVYVADERAAATTDPQTLHDAFEWFCTVNDTDGRESWLRQMLRAEPSIAKRKQRLQTIIEIND